MIVLLLSVLCASAAYSQDAAAPRILVQVSPETPYAGHEWTVTLLIEHPHPAEVTVIQPRFPEAFFLDRVLKSARLTQNANVISRWTAAEYRFISWVPGSFVIEPFEVILPGQRVRSEPVTVNVRNAADDVLKLQPLLEWENVPAQLSVGEPGVLNLRLTGWNPGLPLPEPRAFMPPLNESCVMEALDGGGSSGIALRLRIIPLAVQNLHIPAYTVMRNSIAFEIPALTVSVSPLPPGKTAGAETSAAIADSAAIAAPAVGTFPESGLLPGAGFFSRLLFGIGIFRTDYETVHQKARELFEQGRYAQAFALLRQQERDRAAFPLYATLRQCSESAAGFSNTHSEQPRKFIRNAYFFFCVVFLILFLLFGIRRTNRKPALALGAIFIIVSAGTLLYWLSGSLEIGTPGGVYRRAVLAEAELRPIPDFSAEAYIRVRAGQPVRVFGASGNRQQSGETSVRGTDASWVWITASDARSASGWVLESYVLYY